MATDDTFPHQEPDVLALIELFLVVSRFLHRARHAAAALGVVVDGQMLSTDRYCWDGAFYRALLPIPK